jgi:tRNA (guanine-N(7)-)-methyltransferase subunit TRM82
MPKKPCAVTFTSDDSTIICADKFGDVYALPLHVSDAVEACLEIKTTSISITPVKDKLSIEFIPSASELTVHTKRNQQALKNQQRQKNKTGVKKTFNLDHQLLLGHVSLLTDLIYVTLSAEECNSTSSRSFVITSDRDEHIRVSRGLPQAHVIEAYCLNHTEFVSRICIPVWNRKILISGGGDDYLLTWDWQDAVVRQKVELKSLVDAYRHKNGVSLKGDEHQQTDHSSDEINIAVSGIWAMSLNNGHDIEGAIIVACEGYVQGAGFLCNELTQYRLSALLVFSYTNQGKLEHWRTLETERNVIDVTIISEKQTVLYCMDSIHKPNSTSVVHNETEPSVLGSYTLSEDLSAWNKGLDVDQAAAAINDWTRRHRSQLDEDSQKQLGAFREVLYTIEKLRKRGPNDD